MPIPFSDGHVPRNEYDAIFVTLDAYRKKIEEFIPELQGKVLVDYPNQNIVRVNPPSVTIMCSLDVIRRKLGGTKVVKQTVNPDGQTWTRWTQVGWARIVFQMDLWATNATERGTIHQALMGLLQPIWILDLNELATAQLTLQHYRPIREHREDEVAREIYQGVILTPELIKETLYKVNDVYVGISTEWPEPPPPAQQGYYPNIHVYDADQ